RPRPPCRPGARLSCRHLSASAALCALRFLGASATGAGWGRLPLCAPVPLLDPGAQLRFLLSQLRRSFRAEVLYLEQARISIWLSPGIGLGQRLTQSTASLRD